MAAGLALGAIGTAHADWDDGPSFSIGFAGPPMYYAPPPPPVYYAPPPPAYYAPPPPVYYAPPPPAYYTPAFPAGLSFGITLPLNR
ncbi:MULTISPECIES: hypothetical protein [Acidiphilium]|uniref:Uncharacterized protein n=1 Tax=Acidiphilium iwatense TaxID=768198 RepID=A0ABS9DXZ0_9PROT|nr:MULTISPECIES: hypothetical protein [Acidiphilium]MCF3946675.1 hypothetical protein [Acidiphilium iwatense]